MSFRGAGLAAALAVAALTCATAPARAQGRDTGFLDRSIRVDGVEFRYQVYVPRAHTLSTTWPMVLALHGGGQDGSDGARQTGGGLATAIRRFPERFPAIVVFPQAKADGTPGWHLAGGRAALAALDAAIVEFNGHPSRVYLTGLSAGANGSWVLVSRHPERFAAAVIVCGWVTEFTGRSTGVLYPALSSGPDPHAEVAKRIAGLPIRLFHGDADSVVPVEESRRMFAALKARGADVAYTEYPGVNHNSWDRAYADADLWT